MTFHKKTTHLEKNNVKNPSQLQTLNLKELSNVKAGSTPYDDEEGTLDPP